MSWYRTIACRVAAALVALALTVAAAPACAPGGGGGGNSVVTPPTRTVATSGGFIISMAFSPDWRLLALGTEHGASNDETGARVFDVAGGKLLYSVGQGRARAVAFSPDGSLLAVAWSTESERHIALHDAATGKPLREFAPPTTPGRRVDAVAFSPDGSLLAVAANDSTTICRVTEGDCPIRIDVPAWRVAFSPVGATLLVASDRIALYSALDGSFLREVDGWFQSAYSTDGSFLATAVSGAAAVQLLDTATWQQVRRFEARAPAGTPSPVPQIHGLAYSPDARLVAAGTNNGTAEVWEAATGRHIHTITFQQTLDSGGVAFAPNSKELAVQNGYGVYLYDIP